MTYIQHYDSPLGGILLAADEIGLTGLLFEGQKYFARDLSDERIEQETPVLAEAKRWLDIYFTGKAPDFTPTLHPIGSAFRRSVWGNSFADSLRADRNLRRNRPAACRKAGACPDVRAGGGRRGRT